MIVMFTSPAYSAVRGNNAPSKKNTQRLVVDWKRPMSSLQRRCRNAGLITPFFVFFFSLRYDVVRPHTSCFTLLHTRTPENAGTRGKMLVKGGNMAAARGYAGSPCKLLFLG